MEPPWAPYLRLLGAQKGEVWLPGGGGSLRRAECETGASGVAEALG